MNLATAGAWSGGLNQQEIDGINLWSPMITNTMNFAREMVFYCDSNHYSGQFEYIKYIIDIDPPSYASAVTVWGEDKSGASATYGCEQVDHSPLIIVDNKSSNGVLIWGLLVTVMVAICLGIIAAGWILNKKRWMNPSLHTRSQRLSILLTINEEESEAASLLV